MQGDLASLQAKMETAHEKSGTLTSTLNLARVYQMRGLWQNSMDTFEEARQIVEDYEKRAIVNVRAMAGGVGNVTLSRGSGGYFGTGYERALMHTLNSINYLMLNNPEGAAVEMRRMETRQELWLEEKSERMRQLAEKAQSGQQYGSDSIPGYSLREILEDAEVQSLMRGYQDSFSYALSAIICRIAGDNEYALVSLRRACALNQQAEQMFRAVWGKNTPTGKAWEPKVPPLPAPGTGDLEITVVILGGLTPAKRMEQLRVPNPVTGYLLIDMPSYHPMVKDTGLPQGLFPFNGERYTLLNTNILAFSELQDELSYEIGAAISRAITRAAVATGSRVAASSNRDTQAAAGLIGLLVTLGMDAYASIDAQNVRNWEMLPAFGSLAITSMPRMKALELNFTEEAQHIEIDEKTRGLIFLVDQTAESYSTVSWVQY